MYYRYHQTDHLFDPASRALMRNRRRLRTYQTEALRTIYKGVLRHDGRHYAIAFPRQSGKNETQAYLEAAVMAANLHRGGAILKFLPTDKNQGEVSRGRLRAVMSGGLLFGTKVTKFTKDRICYGDTQVRCLSASRNSAIVGATADLMLEVDEAQMIPSEKYDREVAPMAASTNAAQVFWGTVWDDQTLLAREMRHALDRGNLTGRKLAFRTDAPSVGREVPQYDSFVRSEIRRLGREHPSIRTQYFCEEITDLTGMFSPERIESMRGDHLPRIMPEPNHRYVFLIDIAGSDELTAKSRRNHGLTDRRDATVLTICDITFPDDPDDNDHRPIWNVVGRRYYRNLPSDQLEKLIGDEVERWEPNRIVLDHSGLGCMLSDYLNRRFPHICEAIDITAAAKTRMAWGFLAIVNTGRWREYHIDDMKEDLYSSFVPGRDSYEALRDPALLQQMFFRELRACRIEPGSNAQTVQWGVPDGTRDLNSGRLIHDDLVLSAALSAFLDDTLHPVFVPSMTLPPCIFDPLEF